MKEFYTIFYSVTGDIRAKKMSEKIRNSGRTFHGFLSAEGARGKLPPTSIFFEFPSFGKLEKISL
jgi:hypothetical protein